MSFMPEVKMDFIPDDMTDDESEIGVEEIEDFNPDKDKTQEEHVHPYAKQISDSAY